MVYAYSVANPHAPGICRPPRRRHQNVTGLAYIGSGIADL